MSQQKSGANFIWLLLIAGLLLGQFFLRVLHPNALPEFIDEFRHINRAQAVYRFDQNPIEFSHGKLLLYYWLGLFHPSGPSGLIVARLAIALTSLLAGAAVVAITRLFFGPKAAVFALIFYALVPHAVFFERMALADPLAGAMAALAAWQCALMVRSPTRRRGLLIGLFAGAAALAKLTAALIFVLPIFSALTLFPYRPRRRTRAVIHAWSLALRLRHGPALNAVRNSFVLLALIVGGAAYLTSRTGSKPALIDKGLIGGLRDDPLGTLIARFKACAEALTLLTSGGMMLILIALVILLLIRRPRPTLFVLSWLILLILPSTVFAWKVDSRYLVIGQPALAVLLGGGLRVAGDELTKRPKWTILPAVILLGLWAAFFALPFDWKNSHDPAALRMPKTDRYIYFAGPVNAWGMPEALAYLDKHADPGPIPTVAVFRADPQVPELCNLYDQLVTKRFVWRCSLFESDPQLHNPNRWPLLLDKQWPTIYVITDTLQPDLPHPPWELVYRTRRPKGGAILSVWRVNRRVSVR